MEFLRADHNKTGRSSIAAAEASHSERGATIAVIPSVARDLTREVARKSSIAPPLTQVPRCPEDPKGNRRGAEIAERRRALLQLCVPLRPLRLCGDPSFIFSHDGRPPGRGCLRSG